jgi:hypothetical protein
MGEGWASIGMGCKAGTEPVGAELARDADAAVLQVARVIVLSRASHAPTVCVALETACEH